MTIYAVISNEFAFISQENCFCFFRTWWISFILQIHLTMQRAFINVGIELTDFNQNSLYYAGGKPHFLPIEEQMSDVDFNQVIDEVFVFRTTKLSLRNWKVLKRCLSIFLIHRKAVVFIYIFQMPLKASQFTLRYHLTSCVTSSLLAPMAVVGNTLIINSYASKAVFIFPFLISWSTCKLALAKHVVRVK